MRRVISASRNPNSRAVAELTFALALLLFRPIQRGMQVVDSEDWNNSDFERSQSLGEKSWLALGAGAQVKHLLKFLVGWDVKTIFLVRRSFTPAEFEKYIRSVFPASDCCELVATVETHTGRQVKIVGSADFNDVLPFADIVSVHLPSTDATRKIVGTEFIERCKAGACIVNVSRGDVVDEAAILDGLESRKLFGYAADVLTVDVEQTQNPTLSRLYQAKYRRERGCQSSPNMNIILTPHIGGTEFRALADLTEDVGMQIMSELGISDGEAARILTQLEEKYEEHGAWDVK